jgi:hypothetical protein
VDRRCNGAEHRDHPPGDGVDAQRRCDLQREQLRQRFVNSGRDPIAPGVLARRRSLRTLLERQDLRAPEQGRPHRSRPVHRSGGQYGPDARSLQLDDRHDPDVQ